MHHFFAAVLGCLIAGLVQYSCRLRERRQWVSLLTAVVGLSLLASLSDHGEFVIEILFGALTVSILTRLILGRMESPRLTEYCGLLLLMTLVVELFLGPTLRGAKEIGRRYQQTKEQQRE